MSFLNKTHSKQQCIFWWTASRTSPYLPKIFSSKKWRSSYNILQENFNTNILSTPFPKYFISSLDNSNSRYRFIAQTFFKIFNKSYLPTNPTTFLRYPEHINIFGDASKANVELTASIICSDMQESVCFVPLCRTYTGETMAILESLKICYLFSFCGSHYV